MKGENVNEQAEMFPETPAQRHAHIVQYHLKEVTKRETAYVTAGEKLTEARRRLMVAEEAQAVLERAESKTSLRSIATEVAGRVNAGELGPNVTATVNGMDVDPVTGEVG